MRSRIQVRCSAPSPSGITRARSISLTARRYVWWSASPERPESAPVDVVSPRGKHVASDLANAKPHDGARRRILNPDQVRCVHGFMCELPPRIFKHFIRCSHLAQFFLHCVDLTARQALTMSFSNIRLGGSAGGLFGLSDSRSVLTRATMARASG